MTPFIRLCLCGTLIGTSTQASSAEKPDSDLATVSKLQRESVDSAQMEIGFNHIFRFDRDEDRDRKSSTNFFAYLRNDAKSVDPDDVSNCSQEEKCDKRRWTWDLEFGAEAPLNNDEETAFGGVLNFYKPIKTTNDYGLFDHYDSAGQAIVASIAVTYVNSSDLQDRWEVAPTIAYRFDCWQETFLRSECGTGGANQTNPEIVDGNSLDVEIGLAPYVYSDENSFKRRQLYVEIETIFGRKISDLDTNELRSEHSLRFSLVHDFDYMLKDRYGDDQDDHGKLGAEYSYSRSLAEMFGNVVGCTPFFDITAGHEHPYGDGSAGGNTYAGLSLYLRCGRPGSLQGGSNRMRRRGVIIR